MSCPNKSHPEYKKLVEIYGEGKALIIWERNNEQIPSVEESIKLLFPGKVSVVDALRAWNTGTFSGKNQKQFEPVIDKLILSDPDAKVGGGESFNDVKTRTIEEGKRILDSAPGNSAVITHSTVLKFLLLWDKMGRPEDLSKLTPEMYLDVSTKPGEMEKVKGTNGDIFFIRHGETDDNADGNLRTDDTMLTDKGTAQASKVGKQLKDIAISQVFVSPLPRAVHTTNLILQQQPKEKKKITPAPSLLPVAPPSDRKLFAKELTTTIINQFSGANTVKAGTANALKVVNKDTFAQKKAIANSIAAQINKKYGPGTASYELSNSDHYINIHPSVSVLETEWKRLNERYDAALLKDATKLQEKNLEGSTVTEEGDIVPFYQITSKTKPAPIKKVDRMVKAFIESLGGQINEVNEIVIDGKVISANAVANVITRTIQVVTGKASADTLPEEAAHIYVQWLPTNSVLLRDMLKDIKNRKEYKEVMDEYSSNPFYQNEDGSINEEKIAKEAIGKVIAGVIVGRYTKDIKAKSWFQRVMDWIKKLFKNAEFKEVAEPEVSFQKAATEILTADTSSLDMKAVKAAQDKGEYYFQLKPEEKSIVEKQLKSATDVQKEIVKEVYLDVHDRIILDKSINPATGKPFHQYRDLKIKNFTVYTSTTTAIHGKKDIVGFDDNREWGNDFDALLEGVILGKKLDEIEKVSDRIDAVKDEAYNFLKGLVAAWTADGTIALPQVIVANKNEGIPGALPIAGSIDLLLVHPDGEMTVIDLKTSATSIFERSYSRNAYPTGPESLLPDTQLTKSQGHSIQVMTYVKLLNLMGYPVRSVRTEHIHLTASGDKVTKFTYEKAVPRVMSESEKFVNKIVPTKYEGRNRLDELNEKYETGNPTHRSSFGESKEQKAERLAVYESMEDAILRLFTAAEDWQKYLEDLKHQTVFDVKDDSIRKIDHLVTKMQTLYAEGKKEEIYPLFLSVFNNHIVSVLNTINNPENIKKPNYIRTVYLSKKYLDTFKPFLISSFATATGAGTLFNKIDINVRATDVAIIGAIKNTVKELVQGWSSNKAYLNNDILEAVLKIDKDISGTNLWLDTLGNSGVVILENAAKMLAAARQTVRENVNKQKEEVHELGNKLIEAAGTKDPAKLFSFMYQVGADGKRNGRIVSQKGTNYNSLFEKVNIPLYNLDGTRKEFFKTPSTPEEIQWNKDLYYLKQSYKEFMEPEHTEVEWVSYVDLYGRQRKSPEATTTEGKYHKYTEQFLAERDKYMEQDDFGNWKAKKGETDPEYVAWRTENFDWNNYIKADTELDDDNKRIPTGTVTEAGNWFPKKKNIVSREFAADGTDLWDSTYRKIMQPKTNLEQAQSAFYKGYVDLMREQIEKLPPSAMYWFEQGFVPTLKGNFIDELSQSGAGFATITTHQLRTFFDTTAMSNQSDVAKTGSSVQSIPIMFMASLQSQKRLNEIETQLEQWATKKEGMDAKKWHEKNDTLVNLRNKELHKMTAEQIHPDLVLGLEAFLHMAENFHIMTGVEDTLLAVRDHLKTMKFRTASGKEIEGEKSNALRRLEKFMDMCFYNDPTFTKSVAEVVIQKLQKVTSGMSIPFNIFGTINNKVVARINNRIDALGGDFFSHRAYNRAIKLYNTEHIPGYVATIGKTKDGKEYGEKKAGSLYEWLTDDYNMVRHAHVDQSKVNLLSWGYKGYEAAEWEVQSLVGNAILDSTQMKYTGTDPGRHDCSIRDAYSFDPNTGEAHLIEGYKFLDNDGNIAKDQDKARKMVINRIHETNDRIHGNYDSANKTMLESTIAGKLAIQFHKWVWPNFKARFQKGKFDENLGGGMDIEGRYVTLWNLMKSIAKTKELTNRWGELTPHQKNNLKKDLADLMYFASFFLLAHIVKSLAAGIPDDDPVLKKMANWLRYQSSRGMQEVGLFIPIIGAVESYQLVQNPFAATNALAKFAQLVSSAVEYPFLEDDKRYYQRGNFKGQLKVYKLSKDVIPILREVNRITNLNTVTTFYVK
jgi:broad specificity phosphatase PhoE